MIGEKIKAARQKIGITQKQLAERLGTSPQNLAQYENGKRQPKIETLEKIASALGVSEFDLLDPGQTITEIDQETGKINSISNMSDAYYEILTAYYAEKIKQNDIEVNGISFINTMSRLGNQLNGAGQEKAIEQVELLTKIPEYQKKENE